MTYFDIGSIDTAFLILGERTHGCRVTGIRQSADGRIHGATVEFESEVFGPKLAALKVETVGEPPAPMTDADMAVAKLYR